MNNKEAFKSGFISVIGRPNVGKSTLINKLMGEKILATSHRPQLTRRRIKCILSCDRGQLIFIDTPGIHRPFNTLGEFMVSEAYSTFGDVDLLLFVMDATSAPGPGDRFIAEKLSGVDTPVLPVLNKVDGLSSERLKERIEAYAGLGYKSLLSLSALKGKNMDLLLDRILELLPPGPRYYPEEMVTDTLDELIIADMIREEVFARTREEIPYAVEVQIEDIREGDRDGLLEIYAVLYVERGSQKGIIIGGGGRMLKGIGQGARSRIEGFFQTKVYLDLWVKVKPKWRDKEDILRHFGYRR